MNTDTLSQARKHLQELGAYEGRCQRTKMTVMIMMMHHLV